MKFQLSIIILALMLMPTSSALIISPNPLNIDMLIGELTIPVSIINNHNITLYNIMLQQKHPLLSNIFIEAMPHNATSVINLTIKSGSQYKQVDTIKLISYYYTQVDDTPQAYEVRITDQGFQPSSLTIKQGDSIIITNIDTITHDLQSNIFPEVRNFAINQSDTFTLNTIGSFSLKSLSIGFWGNIEVLNKTSQVLSHSTTYDTDFIVDFDIFYNQTEIVMSLVDQLNFTVGYEGTTEMLFRITNTGNELAREIMLSGGEWISFDQQNFTITPNSNKYVKAIISPLILNTNQTNQSYIIDIKAKGINTPEINRQISIFVPYADITPLNETDTTELFREIRRLRNLLATMEMPEPNNTVIYKEATLKFNMSEQDLYNMKKDLQTLRDERARTENRLNDALSKLDLITSNAVLTFNETAKIQEEFEILNEKAKAKTRMNWILASIALILATTIVVILFLRKKLKFNKQIIGGLRQ